MDTDAKSDLESPCSDHAESCNDSFSNIHMDNISKLEWHDINVYGPHQRESFFGKFKPRAQILHQVSGRMLAVMGSSGAGKTTFLNVLSENYNRSFKVTGNILLDGEYVDMRKASCYVEQYDMFHGRLSVKEHLSFHITLHHGSECTSEKRKERLTEIIFALNLVKCQNHKIGDPGRYKGISGGERKRLNVATEIIRSPKIIYLDEPTSGLDTNMAESVVKSMKNLALNGHIVICTIHQPSSEIFANFDDIYLMAMGRLIYSGSLTDAYNFFATVGYACPDKYNPADHYINMLSINGYSEERDIDRVMKIRDCFMDSCCRDEVENEVGKKESVGFISKIAMEKIRRDRFLKSKFNSSIPLQFYMLAVRATKLTIREPYLFALKVGQAVFIGLIMGLIYLRLEYNTSNIQSFAGMLFFLVTNLSFGNMFQTLNTFPKELKLYYKDHKKLLYRPSVYFITQTMYDIPVGILNVLVLSSILYWMTNLYPAAEEFFLHVFVLFLIAQAAIGYSYIISSLANTTELAMLIAGPLLLPLLLFGGFFINADGIPVYFIWLEYLSWFKYSFNPLIIIQFRKATLFCNSEFHCPGGYINTTIPGSIVFIQFAINQQTLWRDIGMLVVLALAFRLISFIIIVVKTYLSEK